MVATALAMPVSMATFRDLITHTLPEYTICVRGRHAVGKSEGVYQAAKLIKTDFYKDPENQRKYGVSPEDGLPVIERRLSQMTEGDIIGLPFMSGEDEVDEQGRQVKFASTQFKPCDWLIEACKRPVLLFLDERNRALDGVKQAVFQLADSKTFYGYKLHPETRIVIAENIGDEYQVQACDPAEISRCAIVVTLEPSVKEWIEYAKGKCHDALVEFITLHENLLEHTGNFEANKKYPDRRAWFKLDRQLQALNLYDDPSNPLFRAYVGAFVGLEATTQFVKFCSERDRQVSGKDIAENWEKAKRRLMKGGTISAETYTECVNKLSTFLEKNQVNEKQAQEIAKFLWDCPPEPRMCCYSNLQKQPRNLVKVHPLVSNLIVATATGKEIPKPDHLLNNSNTETNTTAVDTAVTEPTVTKRGAKKKHN